MPASPTTASASAPGAGISFTKSANETLANVALFGTYTGVTGVFEGSPDGTNWSPLAAQDASTNAVVSGTITLADNSSNSFNLACPLYTGLRFRVTAISTGTLTSNHQSNAFVGIPTLGGPTSGATLTSTTLTTPTLNGVVKVGDTSNPSYVKATTLFTAMGTPTAETTTSVTMTAAKIAARTLTSTQTAAVTLTLDTGTAMDTAFAGAANNDALEFEVINLGNSSGAVTLTAASGHSIVGLATIAINSTGRFRTRRTGANTWVCYRVN